MTNPPRKRGTAAETAVTRWLRDHGFPHADRQPLRGGRDQGDIDITAGLIAEVKNHRGSPGVELYLGNSAALALSQAGRN